jgi:YVTN family beta-propeller protein
MTQMRRRKRFLLTAGRAPPFFKKEVFLYFLLLTQAAAAEEAFVTDQQGNQVAVLNPATGALLATIPVPGSPAGIAMSPDGNRAYVTSPDDDPAWTVIDTAARKVVRRIKLKGGPLGVAAGPDGRVYVANWYASEVVALDPVSGRLLATIGTGDSPSGLAVTTDGGMLAVSNRMSNSVSLIDTATYQPIGVVKICAHPFGIAIDAEARFAYAACVESDAVAVIDLHAKKEVAEIKVGRRPYVVALSGKTGYVTNELAGTVTSFDLATNTPRLTVHVGENPEGLELSADGKRLYVANWDDNSMAVLDSATLAIIRVFPAGDSPRAFGTFMR